MKTFKEFYNEEKEFESLLEQVFLGHTSPDGPANIPKISQELEKLPELVEKGFDKILSGVSVFFGAKLLGKLIKFILKKNNEAIKDANIETRDSKMMEMGIKISELEKRSKNLSEEEIDNLKSELSEELAKKYPQKKQGWWASLLNKMGDFLDSDVGAGLAVLAFFIV
jgi:hypothetical protein